MSCHHTARIVSSQYSVPVSLSLSRSPQLRMAEPGDLTEVNTRLRSIISRLRQRTERVRTVVQQPPTPPELSEAEEEEQEEQEPNNLILEDFTESRYASKQSLSPSDQTPRSWWREKFRVSGYIDPRGRLNIGS